MQTEYLTMSQVIHRLFCEYWPLAFFQETPEVKLKISTIYTQ